MLTWTQEADGWYANGFRIELRGPHQWVLVDLDNERDVDSEHVRTDFEPLAAETTLSQCKREAAILAAARERIALRRRQTRVLLLTIATAALLLGHSQPFNVVVVATAAFVGLRSLGLILGTLTWNNVGQVHEVFYQ